MQKNKEVQQIIEKLEKITNKKVIFQENYDDLTIDVQRAAKILFSLIGENFKIKSKNLARKHDVRIEAVEAMLRKDLMNIINSKL